MGGYASVRVTVASLTRRVDLVLPGAIPVAELVPELARSVGALEAGTLQEGYRLITTGGRVLAGDSGLIRQGIQDGALLSVVPGAFDAPRRRYDDVVEAMADAVESELTPWDAEWGRRTALVAAALVLTLAAVPLLLRPSAVSSIAAATAACILCAAAIVVSRAWGRVAIAAVMAGLGVGYGTVAGFTLVAGGPVFGLPAACAGAGACVTGLVCLVGLRAGRSLMIAPVVVGGFFVATGLAVDAGPADPATVLSVALTLVVMVGGSLPRVALGASRTTMHEIRSIADIASGSGVADPEQLVADARAAQQILAALSAASGMLVVGVAPSVVTLGMSGTLLAVGCCLAVLLRTRNKRTRAQVLVDLVAGIVGLACVAISVFWFHPGWRSTLAVAMGGSGALLLANLLAPTQASSARWGRAGDLAERAALLALPSLLAVATGTVAAVLG